MKVVVRREVRPSDGSPALPKGEYEVSDVSWIFWNPDDQEDPDARVPDTEGIATFKVVSGSEAGSKRRIGDVLLCSLEEVPLMSLSKVRRDSKRVARNLDKLLSRHRVELEKLAEEVRKNIIVPICEKHGLGYLAGNGRMNFTWGFDDDEITIGNAHEAMNNHGGRFKFLAAIFKDVLELEVTHNDYLGYYVGDVDRSSAADGASS